MIGAPYEGSPCGEEGFPLFTAASRFTDDSVLTVATADALLGDRDYARAYRAYGRKYPGAGYGGSLIRWIFEDGHGPYNSWGNGSAMRVSPVGWACASLVAVLDEARKGAAVTHNHLEGIKGAQAVAAAVFLARKGEGKDAIRDALAGRFGYDLNRRAEDIRPGYRFDVSCQGSVPEALICFFDSRDYEEAVRLAVLLGGDADTQACIAGAVAEAFYGGLPEFIAREVFERLTPDLRVTVDAFRDRYSG